MTVVTLVISIVWYALIEMVCLSIVSGGEIQSRVDIRVLFFIPSLPNVLYLMDKKRYRQCHSKGGAILDL